MNVHSTSYPSPRHLSSRLTFYGVVTVPRATGAAAAAPPAPAAAAPSPLLPLPLLLHITTVTVVTAIYQYCLRSLLHSTFYLRPANYRPRPFTWYPLRCCNASAAASCSNSHATNNRTSAAAARPAGRNREGQREGTDT